MKIIHVGEYECFIGQNKIENWSLLSGRNSWDYIFHLASFPSCYVIVSLENPKELEKKYITKIAKLCKHNTKYKNVPNIKIEYTNISNILKGNVLGEYKYVSRKKINTIKI